MRILWLVVRVVFVVVWARAGWLGMSSESDFPLEPFHLAFAVVMAAVLTRFWVVRSYLLSNRQEPWLVPSWYESPAQPSQPFQFFHMCAYAFIAFALSAVLRGPRSVAEAASAHLPFELFAGAGGIGVLLGMYWAIRSYPMQFVRRGRDAP